MNYNITDMMKIQKTFLKQLQHCRQTAILKLLQILKMTDVEMYTIQVVYWGVEPNISKQKKVRILLNLNTNSTVVCFIKAVYTAVSSMNSQIKKVLNRFENTFIKYSYQLMCALFLFNFNENQVHARVSCVFS